MYNEPKHIESSYNVHNIGKNIYDVVIKLKPKKIVDFGLLYGYSTVCLAQAVRDNGFGEIIGYDLFEDYQYKYSVKSIVEHNLKYYDLEQYVTLKKIDFNEWLDTKEEFDLLHLDISNNGDTILKIYQHYPNAKILFEGGTIERDNIEWMIKYNKTPIFPLQPKINYTIINNNYPGLSGINF